MNWAVRVVWSNGEEEYVKQGMSTAKFFTRQAADDEADFLRIGLAGDPDVQSIGVVKFPGR